MISRRQREEIRNRALTTYTAVQPQPTFTADVVLDLIANVERLEFELDATHKFANGLREEIDTLHTAFEEHRQEIRDQQETINFLRKKLHELGVSA